MCPDFTPRSLFYLYFVFHFTLLHGETIRQSYLLTEKVRKLFIGEKREMGVDLFSSHIKYIEFSTDCRSKNQSSNALSLRLSLSIVNNCERYTGRGTPYGCLQWVTQVCRGPSLLEKSKQTKILVVFSPSFSNSLNRLQ